jgi:hypothetical protein
VFHIILNTMNLIISHREIRAASGRDTEDVRESLFHQV